MENIEFWVMPKKEIRKEFYNEDDVRRLKQKRCQAREKKATKTS